MIAAGDAMLIFWAGVYVGFGACAVMVVGYRIGLWPRRK